MKIKLTALMVAFLVVVKIAFAASTCDPAITSCLPKVEVPRCIAQICFVDSKSRKQFEQENNCKVEYEDCHLANGEDIFRWAIGKKETGGFGYSTPDGNPCNSGNFNCAARTGNPASAGQAKFYSASYGPHQITPQLLISWLNPSGATLYAPPPNCLKSNFLDDAEMMNALKDGKERLKFGENLIRNQKVPAATVASDGSITYPAVPNNIRQKAEDLLIVRANDPESEIEWKELWERMSAWAAMRQLVTNKWAETGGDKVKAWGKVKVNGRVTIVNPTGLGVAPTLEYVKLLQRLGMANNNRYRVGIQTYVTGLNGKTAIWNEAAAGFGSYALFSGSNELYTRMMSFFANQDCYLTAVKQMFKLPNHGYDESHVDPADPLAERWVKKSACAWNTGTGTVGCSYGVKAWKYYKEYYANHFGVTKVCN